MLDIKGKTNAKILADMLSRVSDELNKREGSLIRTSLSAASWAIEGLYLDLIWVQKQAYGETATTEHLDYIAAEAGIERKQPVNAVRYGRFNIAPPLGSQFSIQGDGDTLYYELTKEAVLLPDAEYPGLDYIGELTCDTAGTIGNVYSGSITAVSFVNGLTDAVLAGTAIPGVDIETDDSLRARYMAAVGRVEFAGNINAYKNFMLSIAGVGAVQIYPVWDGPGTVLISAVDDDYLPVTPEKLNELQIAVCPPDDGGSDPSPNGYGMAPIGAVVTVTTPDAVGITITADIKIKPTSSRTIADIQADAVTAITEYIRSQCDYWGEMSKWNYSQYTLTIYYNKVLAELNNIEGVEVATNLIINGTSSDVVLTQSASVGGQEIPYFDSVTLHEV